MKLFLTGGTGFIGSYVLRDALAAGHEVRALRRSASSRPLMPLPREPEWIEADLLTLRQEELAGCDVVVHLASAGVSPQVVPWAQMVKVNVLGSAHLIAVAEQARVARMVVSGTCHEYGPAANGLGRIPVDAPLEPVSLYGASKAAGFQLLSAYAKACEIQLFYGRIFNVYGDGQCEQNFWPSLMRAASLGEDFPMTSGEQIRDFIPVEAVADRILAACSESFATGQRRRLENISSGHPRSLLAFAQQEWKRLGATGKLIPGAIEKRKEEDLIEIKHGVGQSNDLSLLANLA
jgi:nucleoside-diphosphate-sugar epimerase